MDPPVLLARPAAQGEHGRRVGQIKAELLGDGGAELRSFESLHQIARRWTEADRFGRERSPLADRRQVPDHRAQRDRRHEISHHHVLEWVPSNRGRPQRREIQLDHQLPLRVKSGARISRKPERDPYPTRDAALLRCAAAGSAGGRRWSPSIARRGEYRHSSRSRMRRNRLCAAPANRSRSKSAGCQSENRRRPLRPPDQPVPR